MDAFAQAAAALNRDPNLSGPAEWRPAGAEPARLVRVVATRPEQSMGNAKVAALRVELLLADIGRRPTRADRLLFGGRLYRVEAVEPDAEGTVAVCDLVVA